MVQRLKTAKEGWVGIVKSLYMFFAFPFLLFIGVVMFFMVTSGKSMGRVADDALGTVIIWAVIIISIGIFAYGVWSRNRLLKKITASLLNSAYFAPEVGYEMYCQGEGKYLGIDKKNGTILYVHRIRKGQVDVVGLTMDDWTNREVEGNMFRLNTKFPDLPLIEIATPWAQRWFDTLGAMEYKKTNVAKPFAQYVRDQIEKLESDFQIQIPRLA